MIPDNDLLKVSTCPKEYTVLHILTQHQPPLLLSSFWEDNTHTADRIKEPLSQGTNSIRLPLQRTLHEFRYHNRG